jgi:hypothetical protein
MFILYIKNTPFCIREDNVVIVKHAKTVYCAKKTSVVITYSFNLRREKNGYLYKANDWLIQANMYNCACTIVRACKKFALQWDSDRLRLFWMSFKKNQYCTWFRYLQFMEKYRLDDNTCLYYNYTILQILPKIFNVSFKLRRLQALICMFTDFSLKEHKLVWQFWC